jgi:DNA-binding CsgD family transcriptional regulator
VAENYSANSSTPSPPTPATAPQTASRTRHTPRAPSHKSPPPQTAPHQQDSPPTHTFDLDEYVYDALRAGASGFLLKDVPAPQLAAAIRTVGEGDALLAPSITRRLIEEFAAPRTPTNTPPGLSELTPRELEVFRLVATGMSNGEIAAHLIVGETTVKTHITRVLMKLGVRDRVQAVVLAYEAGIVSPGHATQVPGSSPGRPIA